MLYVLWSLEGQILCLSKTSCTTFSLKILYIFFYISVQFSSVQFSRSVMSNSATPWIVARQASLSITNSWSSPKLMYIELVMPSSLLILCHPLLLLPPTPHSIRVFSSESVLHIRWLKNWSFSISPSSEYSGLISFRTDSWSLNSKLKIKSEFEHRSIVISNLTRRGEKRKEKQLMKWKNYLKK